MGIRPPQTREEFEKNLHLQRAEIGARQAKGSTPAAAGPASSDDTVPAAPAPTAGGRALRSSKPPAVPTRNTHSSFIGLDGLKQEHREQLKQFSKWISKRQYAELHRAHYDWWMFPIDEKSSWGFKYSVYRDELDALKSDSEFMTRWRQGVAFVAEAWGWDLQAGREWLPEQRYPGQEWSRWPVRLYKMAKSAKLLGEEQIFISLREFGRLLLSRGERFSYGGHDLSWLFVQE
jgi:hypothetical protein